MSATPTMSPVILALDEGYTAYLSHCHSMRLESLDVALDIVPVAIAHRTPHTRKSSAVSARRRVASQAEDKCALVRRVALQLQERSRALAAENASLRSQVRLPRSKTRWRTQELSKFMIAVTMNMIAVPECCGKQ